MTRARARVAAKIAGAAGAVIAAVVAWWAAVVAARWARAGAYAARFGVRLVTLRAYRRCPACFRVLRREALVCRSCGAGAARR